MERFQQQLISIRDTAQNWLNMSPLTDGTIVPLHAEHQSYITAK